MPDVFISYSRQDADAVDRIKKSLRRRGIDIWIDKDDIGTGSRWDMQIEEGIQACDKVLVMLSKPSAESKNVADEWAFALEKGKHIIPILLEDCDVPMRIASLQRIEFVEDYDSAIEKLTAELRSPSRNKAENSAHKQQRKFKAPTPVLNVMKMAVPALLLIGGVLLAYNFYTITVPKIHGVEPEVAKTVLESSHLTLGEVFEEYSDNEEHKAGTVYKVEPAQARLFGKVDVYVAKAKIEVPDLMGMREAQALELLASKGLSVGKEVIEEAEGEEHTVFKQLPEASQWVRQDEPVTLYYVKQKISLPNVVGMERSEAVNTLEELGLSVILVHSVTRWNTDYGKIFEMEPSAGEKVKSNHKVQITLAQKGGWIYSKQGEKGDIVRTARDYNLRKDTVATASTKIGTLPLGSRVKVLHAKANGWRLVRVYQPEEEEDTIGQL
ncbi:PASTA domain, binds beta-lactams [Alteromonadaceae bacterium Bs31]|nr:PASTA domain, binds beta-lactams [Alteromonadaceae bacterium Bs31]